MSEEVMNDLKQFEPLKPARQILHPLYDNFGTALPKADARAYLKLDPASHWANIARREPEYNS